MSATRNIGFIGQGWIGKHYADDFERRGFEVVRYGLEPEYAENKERIAECAIVFIAVPTPTTPTGFDDSVLRAVLPFVGVGKIAVIKSTVLPGTTEALQELFPDRIVLTSPEFLREANAAYDAANPVRNLIGIPSESTLHQEAAELVLSVLPEAPYSRILPARAAELIKYAGNVFLAQKVVFANLLYDLATALEIPYHDVREALGADPRIGPSHLTPILESGHSDIPGRGAGGHCFIKDTEAFRQLYQETTHDAEGSALIDSLIRKNLALLRGSAKDLDLVAEVYGVDHA